MNNLSPSPLSPCEELFTWSGDPYMFSVHVLRIYIYMCALFGVAISAVTSVERERHFLCWIRFRVTRERLTARNVCVHILVRWNNPFSAAIRLQCPYFCPYFSKMLSVTRPYSAVEMSIFIRLLTITLESNSYFRRYSGSILYFRWFLESRNIFVGILESINIFVGILESMSIFSAFWKACPFSRHFENHVYFLGILESITRGILDFGFLWALHHAKEIQ